MVVSICCFCMQREESSQHLFFDCRVTTTLWECLSKGMDKNLDYSDCRTLLMGSSGSKLVQQIINSTIIHTIWAIWIERNQRRFHDKHQAITSLFNSILAEVRLSFNLNLAKGNSTMQDYKVSRLFSIPFRSRSVIVRQEIHWTPPSAGMVKFNCDGSAIGAHPCGAVGIVIRNSQSHFLGAISSNIGPASAIESEFSAFLLAVEKAMEMKLASIYLESDSIRVVNSYHQNHGFPWKMHARWYNCLKFCNSINCTCAHVLREGNQVADALAKNGQGLAMFSSQWWPAPPAFLSSLLSRDSIGLGYSRLYVD